METQRPKVKDIVKIYCSGNDLFWYYAKVLKVKADGIDVLLPPCDELPTTFSFSANYIRVVGHEELKTDEGWAYIGNMV